MLRLKNNFMELELIALIGDKALFKRLNDSSYIIANHISIHDDFTCDWGSGQYYDDDFSKAHRAFVNDVVKPFTTL